jgi:hypothetical protein
MAPQALGFLNSTQDNKISKPYTREELESQYVISGKLLHSLRGVLNWELLKEYFYFPAIVVGEHNEKRTPFN